MLIPAIISQKIRLFMSALPLQIPEFRRPWSSSLRGGTAAPAVGLSLDLERENQFLGQSAERQLWMGRGAYQSVRESLRYPIKPEVSSTITADIKDQSSIFSKAGALGSSCMEWYPVVVPRAYHLIRHGPISQVPFMGVMYLAFSVRAPLECPVCLIDSEPPYYRY